jgi:THO complex subunit 2
MVRFRSHLPPLFTQLRCSRHIVTPPFCDSSNLETVTTAYHTLLASVLSTWSPPQSLSQNQFIDFIKSIYDALPSSSSPQSGSRANAFGDQLIDMIWSVDAALDEMLSDARLGEDASSSGTAGKTKIRKEIVERDKGILQTIVKRLLVCAVALLYFANGAHDYTGNAYHHSGVM